MRLALLLLCLLASCGSRLTLQERDLQSPEDNATHVFTGVVLTQEIARWQLFRIQGDEGGHRKVFQRRVQVELCIRGGQLPSDVDLYEAAWFGGITGNTSSNREIGRYIFFAKYDGGRLRLVLDSYRCMFALRSGKHTILPGDDRMPFDERLALLSLRPAEGLNPVMAARSLNFGESVSAWRVLKITRGFLRHPDLRLRLTACEALLKRRLALDECWDQFDFVERSQIASSNWDDSRKYVHRAAADWDRLIRQYKMFRAYQKYNLDQLRIMTTINDAKFRRHFCAQFLKEFPNETDHGCPADRPPPASIVTDAGDVPLNPR